MLRRVNNRAMRGRLMEMPSLWDAWDAYGRYKDIKSQVHAAEREFVGDKPAPETTTEKARFGYRYLRDRFPSRDVAGRGFDKPQPKMLPNNTSPKLLTQDAGKGRSITPKLDSLGDKTPKPSNVYGPNLKKQMRVKPARKFKGGMDWKSKLGTAGKAAALTYGAGMDRLHRGFSDRMDEYYARESEEPAAEPAPKKDAQSRIPSTSTVADRRSTPPQGKLRPAGKGLYKSPKPQTQEGPQEPKKDPGIKQQEDAAKQGVAAPQDRTQSQQEQAEMEIRGRAQEMRQRLSAITMAKNPAPKPLAQPSTKTQTAKESARGFLHGVLNLREAEVKWPKSERAIAKLLRSKANIGLRKGTSVKHTFRSNDGNYQYSGRELSMRQKMLAEHRRKNFKLPDHFANMSGKELGSHFDYLSDQGMLEPRKNLDPSYLNYFRRKTMRVGGRLKRKVTGFLSGVVDKFRSRKPEKRKESEEVDDGALIESMVPFCNFAVGNVKYPGDCGCPECEKLIETAGTTFGQNMRGPTQEMEEAKGNIHEDIQKKQFAIKRLLGRRKKKKKRKVREAYEDIARTTERDLMLHRRNPPPLSVTQRPRSYFQTPNLLRRLDRLGMFIAKTAIVAHGLKPMAQSLMWQYKDQSPQFWKDTARAAQSIHDSLIGRKPRVFRGVPVREASFGEEVWNRGQRYSERHPRIAEFTHQPAQAIKTAAHALGSRGVEKLGKITKSEFLQNHAYPLGKLAGYAGLVGGVYGAKKLIYDPIRNRLRKSKMEKHIRKYKKARGELSDFTKGNI